MNEIDWFRVSMLILVAASSLTVIGGIYIACRILWP